MADGGSSITVRVPNPLFKDWLTKHYSVVLAEALAGGPDPETVDWSNELYNTERRLKEKVYRQQIKLSVVGGTTYVDQGNSTLGWR